MSFDGQQEETVHEGGRADVCTLEPAEGAPAAANDTVGDAAGARSDQPAVGETFILPKFEPVVWQAVEETASAVPPVSAASLKRPTRVSPRVLVWPLIVLLAVPAFLWLKDRLPARAAPAAGADAAITDPVETVSAPAEAAAARTPPEPAPAPPAAVVRPHAEDVHLASAPPARSRTARAPRAQQAEAKTASPQPSTGSLSIAAPIPMHVYSGGELVGTSGTGAITLPVGTHDLELVNEETAYRTTRRVMVTGGGAARVRVEVPMGVLHVNATPWAAVWLDGERIGDTPLGNLSVPIGRHEVRFRHPELGERRTVVLVTLDQAARVSIDLRQK